MIQMIYAKLKREWKTFSVALASAVVFGYDSLVANNIDWLPLIPDQYKAHAGFGVAVLMLILRKYT